MVDADLKVTFIEVNTNPSLTYQSAFHEKLVDDMVDDMLRVALDPVFPEHPPPPPRRPSLPSGLLPPAPTAVPPAAAARSAAGVEPDDGTPGRATASATVAGTEVTRDNSAGAAAAPEPASRQGWQLVYNVYTQRPKGTPFRSSAPRHKHRHVRAQSPKAAAGPSPAVPDGAAAVSVPQSLPLSPSPPPASSVSVTPSPPSQHRVLTCTSPRAGVTRARCDKAVAARRPVTAAPALRSLGRRGPSAPRRLQKERTPAVAPHTGQVSPGRPAPRSNNGASPAALAMSARGSTATPTSAPAAAKAPPKKGLQASRARLGPAATTPPSSKLTTVTFAGGESWTTSLRPATAVGQVLRSRTGTLPGSSPAFVPRSRRHLVVGTFDGPSVSPVRLHSTQASSPVTPQLASPIAAAKLPGRVRAPTSRRHVIR